MRSFLDSCFDLEKEFDSRFKMTCMQNETDFAMNTRIYKYPGKALYVAHRDVDTEMNLADAFGFNPTVGVFSMYEGMSYNLVDGPLARTHYHIQDFGSLLTPLEDTMGDKDFLATFGTSDYVPLVDDRTPLNASFLMVCPQYRRTEDTNVATRIGLAETLDFMDRNMGLVDGGFNFDEHDPRIFAEFIAGAEYPIMIADKAMIQRAKEAMR